MFAKRKNDETRPYPWWLLLIGFAAGVILTFIVLQSRQQPVSVESIPEGGIELTATFIIEQATQFAISANADLGTQDPEGILLTATAIVNEATQQAFATPPG